MTLRGAAPQLAAPQMLRELRLVPRFIDVATFVWPTGQSRKNSQMRIREIGVVRG
jgi:hypothetical protein